MKKSKEYFQTHPKISCFVNSIIMILFVWLVPCYVFGNNKSSYILGIISALLIVNILGAFWYPWFTIKGKTKRPEDND
ncbi:hypothetical protein [Sporolactobacillus inulinus]|uniref:Uncharacterized protein n=1 Tax=Sporolactobacillus inulinus CASD TaxID=1069536 RepID=A0A0U1QSB9_9BACL|nr:hypothetical protein [Sporolactobacillus inulinus]KLI03681.1 hypothetical protein SINU_01495 [Sporolactobacillus inulinus CASD]